MVRNLILAAALASLCAGPVYAETGDGTENSPRKTDENTKKSIEQLEKELNGGDKEAKKEANTSAEVGDEALKPVDEVNIEELIKQISKRMELSERDMLSAGTDENTGGLQTEVVQGLNRLHTDIIRDVNKAVDWAKMFKQCEGSGSCSKPGESGEVQKAGEQQSQENQEKSESQAQQQQQQPGSPAPAPYTPGGGDLREDIDRVNGGASSWGHLPARDRADIEHANTVGKIPRYSDFIEEYMKQLNEKK